jgi:spore maturation protein CgeB
LQPLSSDAALSYLGTYAADRADAFHRVLVSAARAAPDETFLVGGPQYPDAGTWPPNIEYHAHVRQPDHLSFYGRGRFTLNLTRGAMCTWGYCPSARLFEAATCGTPLLTDPWPGLSEFFEPGEELIVVDSAEEVLAALQMDDTQRRALRSRARERVLASCTADIRVGELEQALERNRAA